MARRHLSDIRHNKSFRRKSKGIAPRSVTLIVCDGQTERIYFEALRVSLDLAPAEVTIPPDIAGRSPRQIVDFAETKGGTGGGYAQIFCVFDQDDHASFNDAMSRAKQLQERARRPMPLAAVASSPCWEIWVLLHFERTDRPFANCREVIAYIRDHHMPNYEKADRITADALVERVDVVLANAEWLERRARSDTTIPSTSVHHVVRHLEGVARVIPRV